MHGRAGCAPGLQYTACMFVGAMHCSRFPPYSSLFNSLQACVPESDTNLQSRCIIRTTKRFLIVR